MANTIPKYKINPDALHSARRKLQRKDGNKVKLKSEEREALLDLIAAGRKKLYRDDMAISRYQYHLDQISKVKPGSNQFDMFADKIETFQEKYCK